MRINKRSHCLTSFLICDIIVIYEMEMEDDIE